MRKFKAFFAKLTNTLRHGILKSVLALTALVCLGCIFVACNDGEVGAPSAEKETTVAQIYAQADVSLDKNALLGDEANEIAKANFGLNAQVKYYGINSADELEIIALCDGELSSAVLQLSQSLTSLLQEENSQTIYKLAQLDATQKVKESETANVLQKITQAVSAVESQIDGISQIEYKTLNTYLLGEVIENGNSFSVVGEVRSDGTNLLFTVSANGAVSETVIKIENAKNITMQEILQAYSNGNYEVISSRNIVLNTAYVADEPEATVTIGEIYNQNFSNLNFNAQLKNMFIGLIQKGYTDSSNINILFYTLESPELCIYFEMTGGGNLYICKISLNIPEIINNIHSNLKAYILQKLGYSETEEVTETSTPAYIAQMNLAIQQIENDISAVVEDTDIHDMDGNAFGHNTNDTLPAEANTFGEALLQELGETGTVIATYVGDMGAPIFDQGNVFDSGYMSNLQIAVVYTSNNNITISQIRVSIVVYNNEREDYQALYQHILQENEHIASIRDKITIANAIFFEN